MLNLSFALSETTPWAAEGYEIAANQLALTGLAKADMSLKTGQKLVVSEQDSLWTIGVKDKLGNSQKRVAP